VSNTSKVVSWRGLRLRISSIVLGFVLYDNTFVSILKGLLGGVLKIKATAVLKKYFCFRLFKNISD
jgi:hypothetical protein